ncbi:MAG TPA: hypothetical protein VH351_01890 [Bryobacteraceae bacterium]|jgi:Mrp family chromosome partitioning ATPase|nr:hypothetical protein [Bryobacteraceae bacterium]
MQQTTNSWEESLRRTRAMLSGSIAAARLIAVCAATNNPAASAIANLLASAFTESGEHCTSVELSDRSTLNGILTRADQFTGKTFLHCPPLDESSLALEIARSVEGFILIVEIGRQRADVLERNIKALRLSGGVILGAIPVQDVRRKIGKELVSQKETARLERPLVTELS